MCLAASPAVSTHGVAAVAPLAAELVACSPTVCCAVLLGCTQATPRDEARIKERGLLPYTDAVAMFRHKLRFRDVSSEQRMMWRLQLPEYHNGLVGTCKLLVKPLSVDSKARN